MANIKVEIMIEMLFLNFSKADILIREKKLT